MMLTYDADADADVDVDADSDAEVVCRLVSDDWWLVTYG